MITRDKTPTHRDYMEGRVTFEQFYRAVNETGGIRFCCGLGGIRLSEVAHAIERGDEHLNTIPLARWDALANATKALVGRAYTAHDPDMNLKPGTYFWSLGVGVCCWKQAARDAALACNKVAAQAS